MILKSILFYALFLPVVLVYGIGERKIVINHSIDKLLFSFLKLLVCTVLTSVTSYLVCTYILSPLSLMALASVVCLLMYLLFSMLASIAFFKFDTESVMEIVFPAVLLAVTESTSILQCLTISVVISVCFTLSLLLFCAILQRLKSAHPIKEFSMGSIIFISVAIILIAFFCVNVSWLVWLR